MAKTPPKAPQRAVSAAVVSRMLGDLFKVPKSDDYDIIQERIVSCPLAELVPWAFDHIPLYPWYEQVSGSVFTGKKGDPLLDHLVANLADIYLVAEAGAGKDGLWLMLAESAYSGGEDGAAHALSHSLPRGMFNHVIYGEDAYTITAIQLSSCLRQPKTSAQ